MQRKHIRIIFLNIRARFSWIYAVICKKKTKHLLLKYVPSMPSSEMQALLLQKRKLNFFGGPKEVQFPFLSNIEIF